MSCLLDGVVHSLYVRDINVARTKRQITVENEMQTRNGWQDQVKCVRRERGTIRECRVCGLILRPMAETSFVWLALVGRAKKENRSVGSSVWTRERASGEWKNGSSCWKALEEGESKTVGKRSVLRVCGVQITCSCSYSMGKRIKQRSEWNWKVLSIYSNGFFLYQKSHASE